MHNWDDLRYFLAVAKYGSLTTAAEHLGVNQSTMSRRINSFEKTLEVRLFERFATGYELTTEGEALLQRAKLIEEEVHAIDREVMGKNIALEGPIRLTCTLMIAEYCLIPILARFNKIHPGIVVHLDLSNSMHDLTGREADVAIRVTREPVPDTLIGRKIGQLGLGVYGAKSYLKSSTPKNHEWHWIGEDDSYKHPNWLPDNFGPLKLVMRSNDVSATLAAIKQGMGIGRLPHFIGNKEPALKCIETHQAINPKSVWILAHPDMRRVNRVRVLMSFITEHLKL